MKSPAFLPKNASLSLRTKLVLSYLSVALGAILVMIIVVAIAVQIYFYRAQIDQLNVEAESVAQFTAQSYRFRGERCRDGSAS